MAYYEKEEIEKARKMDLLTYLQICEPDNLVKVSGNTYSTREHDSLKISNGKWMWWSQGIGGASALDYLVKVRGEPFLDAVEKVLNQEGKVPPIFMPRRAAPKKRNFYLPARCSTNERVIKYLTERGIDMEIIWDLIDEGLLYESFPYHSCVFVGLDEVGIPRYASYRETTSDRKGEIRGSNKKYSFRIRRVSNKLHVFEGMIDLISYATRKKLEEEDWQADSLLSLGGVYSGSLDTKVAKVPIALEEELEVNGNITTIVLHLDNDDVGREATESIREALKEKYEVINEPPTYGKDMNDELMYLRKGNRDAEN